MTKNEKSPEKRHVILEDLDRYEIDQESRRKKLSLLDLVRPGRQSGVMHWHRLFSFARPYVRKIIISLIITWVAASLMGAKLWFINEGVQPIIDPEQVVKEEKEDPDVISRVKDRVFGLFSSDDEEEEAPPEAEAPSEFDPSLAREKLALLIVIFTLVIIIEQTLNYFQSILIRSAGHSITMDIRNALFAKVMSFSLRFHNKNHSGKLVSRITGDINVFGTFFTNTAVEMIRDTTQFVVCVIALAWLGGWQIFVLSACVCGIFLPVQAIARKIRRRDKQILRSRSLIYSQLTEALSGCEETALVVVEAQLLRVENTANIEAEFGRSEQLRVPRSDELKVQPTVAAEQSPSDDIIGVKAAVMGCGRRRWSQRNTSSVLFFMGKRFRPTGQLSMRSLMYSTTSPLGGSPARSVAVKSLVMALIFQLSASTEKTPSISLRRKPLSAAFVLR